MAISSFCPNCGSPVQSQAAFCGNCGTRISSITSPAQQTTVPGYLPTVPPSQSPVSTGAYKAVIAALLVIIVLLGIGLYSSSSGHIFQFGSYRYSLANPPNAQSIQPPNTTTPPPPYTTIWNACGASQSQGCPMTRTGWREGGVPDTYDYFVSFTSNVNVTVYFLTLGQFVQFAVCNGDLSCVSGSYAYLPASPSQQNATFKLAEGCGDYVAIYVASDNGIMWPNVSVKQNPAQSPTGYCRQIGSS